MTCASWYRRFLSIIIMLVFPLLLLNSCSAKITGRSQETFRSPNFSIPVIDEGGLALLPVMVLARPTKSDKGVFESQPYPSAPYASTDPQQSKETSRVIDADDVFKIGIGDMLLRNVRNGHRNIRVVSPSDCLKCINDDGLTDFYLKFDRDFSKTGIDGNVLSRFANAFKCRYIFISQAVIHEYKSDSSLSIIWTFGKKSTLRSVHVTGQIWDSTDGHRIWAGHGTGYIEMNPYEKAPLTEDITEKAFERLIATMFKSSEQVQSGELE